MIVRRSISLLTSSWISEITNKTRLIRRPEKPMSRATVDGCRGEKDEARYATPIRAMPQTRIAMNMRPRTPARQDERKNSNMTFLSAPPKKKARRTPTRFPYQPALAAESFCGSQCGTNVSIRTTRSIARCAYLDSTASGIAEEGILTLRRT